MDSKRKQLCQYNQESPFILGTVFFPTRILIATLLLPSNLVLNWALPNERWRFFQHDLFQRFLAGQLFVQKKNGKKHHLFFVVLRFYTPKGLTSPPKKRSMSKGKNLLPNHYFWGDLYTPPKTSILHPTKNWCFGFVDVFFFSFRGLLQVPFMLVFRWHTVDLFRKKLHHLGCIKNTLYIMGQTTNLNWLAGLLSISSINDMIKYLQMSPTKALLNMVFRFPRYVRFLEGTPLNH